MQAITLDQTRRAASKICGRCCSSHASMRVLMAGDSAVSGRVNASCCASRCVFYEMSAAFVLLSSECGRAIFCVSRCWRSNAHLADVGSRHLALASVAGRPFDNETCAYWQESICPFTMFHLAGCLHREIQFRRFEVFALSSAY